jgi:hypothetical protein
MARRGRLVDRGTQLWVRATGRRVEMAEHPWLDGPIGGPDVIADAWVFEQAGRLGGSVREGGGLFQSMAGLAGDGFDPARLAAQVRSFYEATDEWRLDVWSQWSPAAWPFGWLLSTVFAKRLEQLSLPLRPLDVAFGLDSRVLQVIGPDGGALGAAWLRTLRSTGETVYSGWYGMAQLPGHPRPSVRVVFPLPNGSVTVFLRPDLAEGGALRLTSPLGRFGDDGAYLIVRSDDRRTAWVRRVPLAEHFLVSVDAEGVLRTDHRLLLRRLPVIRLHYRLGPRAGLPGADRGTP